MIKGSRSNFKKPLSVALKRLDGGLNLRDLEMKIGDVQSPSMLNLMADGRGGLTKRYGQMKVFTTSLGNTGVNGITYFNNKIVFAHGTNLYTQEFSNQPISIKTGITDAKGSFINYNSKLYYWNGYEALVYDGITVTNLTDDVYIPKTAIDLKPDGSQGGTVTPDTEDKNLLSPYFYKTFIGDGTSTEYNLNETNLDDIPEVKINGTVKTLTTDYTVNLITGKVNFVVAPAQNTIDPDNVQIKCKKINASKVNQILNCNKVFEYEQKLFLTGNTNYKNKYFVMGITDRLDAMYWPENGFNNLIGGSDEPITGFTEFYNKLIIFKEHSIHALTFTTSGSDTISNVKKISSVIGCDMPGSIQTVNNNPIFCNSYGGLHLIVSTLIESEKNVVPISALINGGIRNGLLDEAIADLENCSSVDFKNKYRLCIGSKEYVWDYSLQGFAGNQEALHFFLNSNINAGQYLIIQNDLFYGCRGTGEIAKFITAANDFGNPIDAYFTSKLYDFGILTRMKNIKTICYATKPGTSSTITVEYTDDSGIKLGGTTSTAASGSWDLFTWDTFTWDVSKFSKPFKLKPNIHNKEYFQIKFSNNIYNENLSLLDLIIEYSITKSI